MRFILAFTLFCLGASLLPLQAQDEMADSTGLPGDHFNLQAALELFKKAGNPEEYEKLLNMEDNKVNNLDLDQDGSVDYIRVVESMDQDAHVFVLQVPVSETESQDIAVIELEKTGAENAVVQIVGDEDIFGEQVIVEPGDPEDEEAAPAKKKGGPSLVEVRSVPAVVINVWGWPCVRFVYRPGYTVWASPWRWRVYPTWWRPWRPLRWHYWHPYRHRVTVGFRIAPVHRVTVAHRVYVPTRRTSVTVTRRHAPAVNHYRVSHTKTKVTGPRGNTVTKRTTTVKGPKGNVKAKRTTVTKRKG